MYLNSKEEKIIGEFLTFLDKKTEADLLTLKWDSGTEVIGTCLCIYESDNGLELSDPNYEEMWAVAITIKEIIQDGEEIHPISEDNIFEVTYHNCPNSFESK